MNVLCVGDIVGRNGLDILKSNLNKLREEYNIDFVIANGENSCAGRGIKDLEFKEMIDMGIDVVTMGNHLYYRKEAKELYKNQERLLIPLNMNDPELDGHGYIIVECKGKKIAVVNFIGKVNVFTNTENIANPFKEAEKIIKELEEKNVDYIFVDFHAEATAEKLAMGYFLDGRITCLFGTHTHIQTADERILMNGTAYITDVGMTGPKYSVLGLKKEIAIKRFYDESKEKYEYSNEGYQLNSILVEVGEGVSNTKRISRLNL